MSVNIADLIRALQEEPNKDTSPILHEIYTSYRIDVLRWLTRMGATHEDAEDIFQMSIVTLFDNVVTGKIQYQSSLKTYLFGICRYQYLNLRRQKHQYSQSIEKSEVDLEHDDSSEITSDLELLKKALIELGDPCKTLLEQFYGGLSYKEIAESLGYNNESIVKSKKYKCLMRLRELIVKNKYQNINR